MKYMKLPPKVTVYVKGKKYAGFMPATSANLVPDSIMKKIPEGHKELSKEELKKLDEVQEKKDVKKEVATPKSKTKGVK